MSEKTGDNLRPKVSVCMATYNGDNFIYKQIASIIKQLGPLDEIVVVDDASSDNTIAILREFNDNRIRIHEKPKNQGVIKSFEQSIKFSTGQIIFLCDQDDIWHAEKVHVMVESILKNRCLAIVSDCRIINEDDEVTEQSFFAKRGSRPGFLFNLWRNGYLGCAMCFSANLKEVILPFPNKIFMHDEWIGLMADLSGEVMFIENKLFDYRRHQNNVSKLTWGGLGFAIKKRIFHATSIASRIPAAIKFRIKNQN